MSLYRKYFYVGDLAELFSARQAIFRMLRVEAALAQAQANHKIIPEDAAKVIAECCKPGIVNLEALAEAIPLSGNAVISLVNQLSETVRARSSEAAKFVHLGATSQDIIDTALVLQIHEFYNWLEKKLSMFGCKLAVLTRKHRDTPMVGRTLLQQAKPITFGLKTAGWLEGIRRSQARVLQSKERVLQIQLTGAVGGGNNWISGEVQRTFAEILDLNIAYSWQSCRDNIAEFATVLGILTGSLGKIAKDVILLMQTEVGEVFEGAANGKGGSSTMPHKRNPVTATAILANAHRIPHLVATVLAGVPQEHERSAGLWHAEWEVLPEIMQLAGGALAKAVQLIDGLEVDDKRMLLNLELTNGLIYAENVSLALAPVLGKSDAHAFVKKACDLAVNQKRHLREVLIDLGVALSNEKLQVLFKAEHSLGSTLDIIDKILEKHEDTL